MIRNLGLKLLLGSALALGCLVALPASAQSPAPTAAAVAGPAALGPIYDVAKEIKIQGNILKFEAMESGGGLVGTHAQIQTPEGVVDAQLGSGGFARAQALGLYPGLRVTIIGMMATVDGNSILLARVLTTANHVFILRNERGIPVRTVLPRSGASAASVVKGGL
jgi:hypothetical protein